jgi:hypothetical protein
VSSFHIRKGLVSPATLHNRAMLATLKARRIPQMGYLCMPGGYFLTSAAINSAALVMLMPLLSGSSVQTITGSSVVSVNTLIRQRPRVVWGRIVVG